MQHRCVQVRRRAGTKKNCCEVCFADFIFAKGMQLKINIFCVFLFCCGKITPYNPPPQISEEIPTNRRTNRRTDFSAKQAPSALDLSPRPQTHLPYGCSIVAVMWKCKISLNFRKKISSLGIYMVPGQLYSSAQWWPCGICLGTHFCWRGFNSHCLRTGVLLHFFFTCLPEKIGSPCTNKACWKKISAHRFPICIPLCAGWVCSTHLQSSLGLYMVPELS